MARARAAEYVGFQYTFWNSFDEHNADPQMGLEDYILSVHMFVHFGVFVVTILRESQHVVLDSMIYRPQTS